MEKSTANHYDGGNEFMKVDQAWLDFLRDQFPKGSQVRSWELDDPEHISIGTLEQIDEEGRFHTRLEDGTIRKLTLGEEQFSVQPPEPALLKLYMPMTADLYERDEWGDMSYDSTELDSRDLVPYSDMILGALVKNRMPEERERGLMYWYEERDSVPELGNYRQDGLLEDGSVRLSHPLRPVQCHRDGL